MGRKSREQLDQEAADKAAAMTNSPEFQAAVASQVSAALEPLLAKLGDARVAAGSAPEGGDRSLMRELALSLAELTTQGSGKVKVSPEVIMLREESREKMVALIIEARAEKKVPTYHLANKIFMNNRIIEPFWVHPSTKSVENTELDFWGIPNEAMVPANDTAKAIFKAYKGWIGTIHGVDSVANRLPGNDALSVTPNGLVIRNSATVDKRRQMEVPAFEAPKEGPMQSAYDDSDTHDFQPMTVKQDGVKGQFKNVNILGTIQDPARQTV